MNHFARHGYAGVRVDIRGSGNSDGRVMDEYCTAGAGRRARGAEVDRRAAVVRRRDRHDRRLVGRLQRPSDRGPRAARAEGRRHLFRERRPVRRRRALPRRLRARHGHAALVGLDDELPRAAAAAVGGRRRLEGAVARPARDDGAARRDVALAPAPRRLLAAGLGARGLLRHPLPRDRDRRLDRRLYRRGAAPHGRPRRAAARRHRPVGPQRHRGRCARPWRRRAARGRALVGSLAEGHLQRRRGRADAGRLPAGPDRAGRALRGAARALGDRADVAVARRRDAHDPVRRRGA